MGDGGVGGCVAVFGRGLLCEQISEKSARTGTIIKLLRVDNPLVAKFPHFLRESKLIVQLLD